MRYAAIVAIAVGASGLWACAVNAQGPADAFKVAYAAAQTANAKAGALKDQWPATSAALAAAQKAADEGDYDTATKLVAQAQALANASVAQDERESKLWKESELR